MIQLIEITSLEEANEFMKKHINCAIIRTNPFLIQYEIEEEYSKPIMELKGMPRRFLFCFDYKWSYDITSGHIMIFNEFMLFKGHGKKFFKLTYPGCKLTSNTSKKALMKEVDFIDFHNGGGGWDLNRTDTNSFRRMLGDIGIVTTNSNLLYHERTNTIMNAAQIQAQATLISGIAQAKATEKLAQATLIASIEGDKVPDALLAIARRV